MGERGVLVELYDLPDSEELTAWIYASRYPEVFQVYPGIRAIKRYEIVNPARPGQQRILMVLETDDVEGVELCRRRGRGLEMKRDSDARGVGNRLEYYGRLIYEGHKGQDGTVETAIIGTAGTSGKV